MHSTYAYLRKHRYAPVRFLSLTNPPATAPVLSHWYGPGPSGQFDSFFNGGGSLLLAPFPCGSNVYNAERSLLHAVLPDNLSNNAHIPGPVGDFLRSDRRMPFYGKIWKLIH
jgi:hypothetical protein